MPNDGDAQTANSDAPEQRLYLRPRPGESTKDVAQRMREGVLALIAQQRAEEADGDAPIEADMPADAP